MSDALRLVVTGTKGQVVGALRMRGAAAGVDVIAIGRPDLDFRDSRSIAAVLNDVEADAIVNAAAYTAVDKAESEPDVAMAINAEAAGAVAQAAARRGTPIIQLSTDYVFDGDLDRPYREDDPVDPTGAYGRSKLAGELAVIAAGSAHVVLRTAWVYSPFGSNFVRTMLRLGETRDLVRIVADQCGNPTSAFNIADAVIAVARNLRAEPKRRELFGLFHVVDSGEATWADFAEAIFAEATRLGHPAVRVERIATSDYPTPARRPANSRLDASRFARIHGVVMPDWRVSLAPVVRALAISPNH
jgi:dTDP-4-dehydrorhamnose reductase